MAEIRNKESDNTDSTRRSLLQNAVSSYEKEYAELSEIWRNIDHKAEVVIAASGIFLGGTLAVDRVLIDTTSSLEQWILTLTTMCLVLSVIFGMIVLWVRSVPSAPFGEPFDTMDSDINKSSEMVTQDYILNICRDELPTWKAANKEVRVTNERKAFWLIWAQIFLFVAVLLISFVTLLGIWQT